MKLSKLKKFMLILAVLAIPAIASAQLAGVERWLKSLWILDDNAVFFGNRPDTAIGYKTTLTNDGLMIGLSTDSRTLHIADYGDTNFNFATANYTNPSLVIHSANQSTTEYMRFYHDGTNGRIAVGAGSVAFDNGLLSTDLYATGTLTFEGSTPDTNETTLTVADPNADQTITLPNATGFVALGGNVSVPQVPNQDCNTTCGTSAKCMFGQDGDASGILRNCASATSDVCVCIAQ